MSDDPDEEFRRIVEGLELELNGYDDLDAANFDEAPPVEPEAEQRREAYAPEQSYEADFSPLPAQSGPLDLRLMIAWIAVGISPVILIVASLSSIVLPRAVSYGCSLLFIAAAVYLFSRIPNRRDDNGDDGAVV